MDRYFITGATGFIGMELTRKLTGMQIQVHALVRYPEKMASLTNPYLKLFRGDITDPESVEKAMEGCTKVFHLAAYAHSSAEDPAIFDQVNVNGTGNILAAAMKMGIRKMVFTSTAGTFNVTDAVTDDNEDSSKPEQYDTDYARTKRAAELLCEEYFRKGLQVVTVYPTRVFGPGVLSESNSVMKILDLYSRGKWRAIPADGKTYGNYVYIGDVVNGHILAMEKGVPGEGYILGGENVTFDELFAAMGQATECRRKLVHIPYPVLWLFSETLNLVSGITGTRPLITTAWLRRYLQHRRLSSQKAVSRLGYSVTPLAEGLRLSYKWLKTRKLNNDR
jgi:farnesol dehydrogenase